MKQNDVILGLVAVNTITLVLILALAIHYAEVIEPEYAALKQANNGLGGLLGLFGLGK